MYLSMCGRVFTSGLNRVFLPTQIDFFRERHIFIKSISAGQLHCVCLSRRGHVYILGLKFISEYIDSSYCDSMSRANTPRSLIHAPSAVSAASAPIPPLKLANNQKSNGIEIIDTGLFPKDSGQFERMRRVTMVCLRWCVY